MRWVAASENGVIGEQVVVECEDHLTTPLVHSALQGSQLTICILAGIALLKLLQECFGRNARFMQIALVQFGVKCGKRILTHAPGTRSSGLLGPVILPLPEFTACERCPIGLSRGLLGR
jgi:hypothetical protein